MSAPTDAQTPPSPASDPSPRLLSTEALAQLDGVNKLGPEYALRGFARELTRQRMTLSIRLHGCSPPSLLAWLAPGLRGAGCTLTNRQIAAALDVSPHTVRKHLAALEATGEIQRHQRQGRSRRLTFGVAEGLHEPPQKPERDRETVTPRPLDGHEPDRLAVTSQETRELQEVVVAPDAPPNNNRMQPPNECEAREAADCRRTAPEPHTVCLPCVRHRERLAVRAVLRWHPAGEYRCERCGSGFARKRDGAPCPACCPQPDRPAAPRHDAPGEPTDEAPDLPPDRAARRLADARAALKRT